MGDRNRHVGAKKKKRKKGNAFLCLQAMTIKKIFVNVDENNNMDTNG